MIFFLFRLSVSDPYLSPPPSLPQDGGTALYGAVNDGHLKMAELLLSAGASASISGRIPGPDGSVVDGWTALHAAVSHGNAEMVKLLVERGAVVDATTSTCSPDGTSISVRARGRAGEKKRRWG